MILLHLILEIMLGAWDAMRRSYLDRVHPHAFKRYNFNLGA